MCATCFTSVGYPITISGSLKTVITQRSKKKKLYEDLYPQKLIRKNKSQKEVRMPLVFKRITKDLRNELETLENPLHFGCQK